MSDEELAQVSGGNEDGYWDAFCTACQTPIGGAGIASFTWQKSEEKLITYNAEGCPECGAKGTMVRIPFYIEW